MKGANINNNLLGEFINILEQSEIIQHYSGSIITTHIPEDTGLVESMKFMRHKKIQKLIVLDESGVFQGVLLDRAVEKHIVDNVLQAKENA